MARSKAEELAAELSDAAAYERRFRGWSRDDLLALAYDWSFWARPEQLAPQGDWRHWLIMAGRGFGKTRAGAEWVRGLAEADGAARIALIGATQHEVRQVMVEGESGLLAIAPPQLRPDYEPSLRRLTWPGGAQAFLYSAAEPEALRGPQHHAAWADEIAKWPDGPALWDNLVMGLRLGDRPRTVATTTPRPVPLLRRLLSTTGLTLCRGATEDNRFHLPDTFLPDMHAIYGGTRLGRQELGGELIEDVPDALWSRALIERRRVRAAPETVRVVIGVDPPAGVGDGSDACGIVAVALGRDGRAYVLADASVRGLGPSGWARAVAAAVEQVDADRVVAEANNGGEMVRSVLHAASLAMPVTLVHAAHSKVARAEPVALLYEAGRAWHAGAFPELEDELCGLVLGGGYHGPGRSPDRADALVWAMTELMLRRRVGEPGVRQI